MNHKTKTIFLALIFLGLFGLAESSEAKNLYVNNSGNPACSDTTTYINNSVSNPWCTLLRAVRGNSDGQRATAAVPAQAAQAGDTVYVSAGTYNYAGTWIPGAWTGVLYDPVNSGTSGAWITFQAVGTVNLTGSLVRSSIFGSNTGQYIEWDGFTVSESNTNARMAVTTTVNNIKFENNTIIGAYYDFGYADNHAGLLLHGPYSGVCAGGISNVTIRNNTITGYIGGSGRNDAGIKLYCLGANILIENNTLRSNYTGIHAKTNYVDNQNIIVRKNIIRDNSGEAISIQGFSNWYVYQNIIVNNSNGFNFFSTNYYQGNTKPHDVYVVNNTMYGNATGISFKSTCSNLNNNHVKNNLIIGTTNIIGGESTCTSVADMGTDDVHFDYNYYGHSGYFFASDGGAQVSTYANWQSSYGQSAHSSNGTNPLFVNAAGNNFRLQGGSPAISAGIDILDLNNNGQTNDAITLGAYINGNECIGLESGCGGGDTTAPSAPSGLSVQ